MGGFIQLCFLTLKHCKFVVFERNFLYSFERDIFCRRKSTLDHIRSISVCHNPGQNHTHLQPSKKCQCCMHQREYQQSLSHILCYILYSVNYNLLRIVLTNLLIKYLNFKMKIIIILTNCDYCIK